MNIENSPVFNEFFNDPNVNFPEFPRLIQNIGVYDAPHGLGLQFRGGPKKLVIKGKNAPIIWNSLSHKMDGSCSLQELLEMGMKKNIDLIELCKFFKLLHCNHLFSRNNNSDSIEFYDKNQLDYYDRLIGVTGFRNQGKEVTDTIKKTKLLLICNSEFLNHLILDLKISNFQNFGILYINDTENTLDENTLKEKFMTFVNISNMENSDLENLLYSKIDDYNLIFSVLNNPSNHFLKNISKFCSDNEKMFLPINLKENVYEAGPFFIPKVSSCSNCYTLRNQSNNQNSIYDFVYQNSLTEKKVPNDSEISGYDLPSFKILLNLSISEIIRNTTNFSKSFLTDRVFELDTITYSIKFNDLIKVSNCYSCS